MDQTNWGALSSTNLYEIQTLDMIVELNLTQYAPTQLDVLLCNNPELVTACTLEDTATQYLKQFSDHKPITTTLYFDTNFEKQNPRKHQYAFKKADWDGLNQSILAEPFNPYCFRNVDHLVNQWYDWLWEKIDKFVPRVTQHRSNLQPWISRTTSHLMQKLKTLKRKGERGLARFLKVKKLEKDVAKSAEDDLADYEKTIFEACHETLSKSLTFIFQTCINKGIFPSIWKTSQVAPIFKEGNKADVSCYRPISLLCCCSKILEKVIFDALYSKVKDKLHDSQFGFRKRRSATVQLLLFLDKIYELNDQKSIQNLAVLYLDFAKAFDTVPHDILIQKIGSTGVGGKLLSLIQSYLVNRKQCVKIDHHSSSYANVTSGVPQGSILGPLLFLIFINDLPQTLTDTISYGYADDFKAILMDQVSLNTATSKIESWLDLNKMQPNIKKSTILSIKGNLRANMMSKTLSTVDTQKDLGLMVSSNLNWNENCSRRASKAIKAFYQIKRSLTNKCTIQTKLNAYTGYVVQIATNASQAWYPSRNNMDQLERVQKLATKWILCTNSHYKDRLAKLKLLPLSLYIEMHDILMLLALIENKYDVNLNKATYGTCETTRQSNRGEFQLTKTRLQKTDENFFRRTKTLYNCLIRTCSEFKENPNKSSLTNVYFKYFDNAFNELNKCTWKLYCRCGSCNIYNKLKAIN